MWASLAITRPVWTAPFPTQAMGVGMRMGSGGILLLRSRDPPSPLPLPLHSDTGAPGNWFSRQRNPAPTRSSSTALWSQNITRRLYTPNRTSTRQARPSAAAAAPAAPAALPLQLVVVQPPLAPTTIHPPRTGKEPGNTHPPRVQPHPVVICALASRGKDKALKHT